MFLWLWRRLGLANGDAATAIEYDAVYGLPKHAVADWLKWNPHLKTGHADKEAERLRRDGIQKKQVDALGEKERAVNNS